MTSLRVTFPLCVLLILGACDPGSERSGELVVVFQAEDGRVTEGHQGEYFVGTTTVGETHEAREVTIDGQLVPAVSPSGQVVWRYDPLFNAILFEPGAGPQGGQTIEVTYFTGCFS